jgi:hypothetical protein
MVSEGEDSMDDRMDEYNVVDDDNEDDGGDAMMGFQIVHLSR